MTTIVLDDYASLPVAEVLRQATNDVIELRNAAGELVATVLLAPQALSHADNRETEYAELVANAEADIEELRRLARTPRDACVTTAEVLARARAHAPE